LYIHVPFCLSKCPYCGFYSAADLFLIEAYLAALRREMAVYKKWTEPFDTIYVGGGTPSVLAPRQIANLAASARSAFHFSEDVEITIETNPADITVDLLQAISMTGVNRISIGVQSFSDDILTFLGRRDRADQARNAVKTVRKSGIENISIDLIYGIPGQQMKVWEETLYQAVALQPEHLSCYQLTVERGTPFAKSVSSGAISLPDEEKQAEFFFRTAAILEKHGYLQYEVSNFAIPGKESRHNQKYWDHTPYLGLGPSAHTFTGSGRRWNRADTSSYINDLTAGRLPVEEEETLDREKLRMETLFLGFRTRRGICLDEYRLHYGRDLLQEKRAEIDSLRTGGFVEVSDGFLKPTRQGMAVADSLALI
jgi:oxygen-independent coproporphyrinogen-3 oxidase